MKACLSYHGLIADDSMTCVHPHREVDKLAAFAPKSFVPATFSALDIVACLSNSEVLPDTPQHRVNAGAQWQKHQQQ